MKFYTNKYPVGYAYNSETKESEILPVGTVFTIESINNDSFDLKVVGRPVISNVMVGINMIKEAFTESSNFDIEDKSN